MTHENEHCDALAALEADEKVSSAIYRSFSAVFFRVVQLFPWIIPSGHA